MVGTAAPGPAAPAEDWSACRRAIAAVEPGSGLPPGLLLAIALVESGRRDPASGRVEPWPWAMNVEGAGRLPSDRASALAELRALQARGVRSVDVGCMQVNLAHHPQAFPSLEAAFDPPTNVRYAAAFLRQLFARTGDWPQAIASYHSGEDLRGLRYHRRVALARIGAGLAAGGPIPLPAAA
ncbi:MAG: lytic transglycosylase domain-containing protein, partial [Acetobacteraceae bacterium]|nr:lytic transglycosylase domain-containing protein [Acetobacteraceae bacterium]